MAQPYVLHLASWHPDAEAPHLAPFIPRHVAAIHAEGLPGALIAVQPSDTAAPPYQLTATESAGILAYLGRYARAQAGLPGVRSVVRFRRYWQAQWQAYRRIEKRLGRPALLHVHVGYPAGIFGRVLARRLGIPYVVTEHMSDVMPGSPKGAAWSRQRRWVYRWALAKAAAILPVSQPHAEALQRLGIRRPMHPVGNVVDVARIPLSPLPAWDKAGTTLFRWFQLSWPAPSKNLEGLIGAAHILDERGTNFHLTIGGESTYRAGYEALAHEWGLVNAGRVAFLGTVAPEDVPTRLPTFHAVVLPSFVESFGVVAIEALAAGRPIAATPTGAFPSLISPETGVLAAGFSAEAIATAMQAVMDRYATFTADACRQAAEAFAPEYIGAQIRTVYSAVTDGQLG